MEYTKAQPVIIGVDTGNKLIKTANGQFVAGLNVISDEMTGLIASPMDVLRWEGQNYAISQTRTDWRDDKSDDTTYLILTLMGIAREIEHRKISRKLDVVLAVGLPPGHLNDSTLVNNYKRYFLKGGGVYYFTCGKERFQIRVVDVIVCPQGFSALLTLNEEVVTRPDLYLIDIGGGTCDTVHFKNKKLDAARTFSRDLGVIVMYSWLRGDMQAKFRRDISESDIDDILIHDKPGFFRPEHVDLVHNSAKGHVKKILAEHRDLKIDLLTSDVVFLGGGAILLQKQIRDIAVDVVGSLTVLSNIRANAAGYEKFASARLKIEARQAGASDE